MAEPSSSVQQSSSGADAQSQGRRSSSSASPSRKSNKIFNNIVNEQSRTQMKHHHVNSFWNNVASEVIQGTAGENDFQHQDLNFSGVTRVMQLSRGATKSYNPNPEATLLMTRACELLILEMAVKSCVSAGQLGRSTIEKRDISDIIRSTEEYDIFSFCDSGP